MNAKYEFTRLLVSDFKSCFLFYRDVMGFQARFGTENDTYTEFVMGATNISLFDKSEMSQALGISHLPSDFNGQDKICLVFAVENVDDFCRHLKEKGIPIVVEPMDRPGWSIRTAHFRDPDGNLIEVNCPLQK